jgi:hypothetical protein
MLFYLDNITPVIQMEIQSYKSRGYTASQIKDEYQKQGINIFWPALIKAYNKEK